MPTSLAEVSGGEKKWNALCYSSSLYGYIPGVPKSILKPKHHMYTIFLDDPNFMHEIDHSHRSNMLAAMFIYRENQKNVGHLLDCGVALSHSMILN